MKYLWLLLLSVGIGCLLRFWGIWSGGFLFSFDQGRDILDVAKIASGNFTLLGPHSAINGVFSGPLYYYLLTIPFLLSKGDPRAIVLFMGVWSVSSMLYGYFITDSFAGKIAGVFFVIFAAVSSPLIAFSRYFHNPNPLGFIMVVFIFCLLNVLVRKNNWYYLPLFFITGLMFHFEIAVGVAMTAALFVVLLMFTRLSAFKQPLFYAGICCFIAAFTPQLIFELRNNFLMGRSIMLVATGQREDLYTIPKTQLASFEEKEFIPWDDFTTAVGIDRRVIAAFWLGVTVLGISKAKPQQREIVYILLALVGVFWVGSIVYRGPIYGWYRAGFPQLYIFITAIGASVFWKTTTRNGKWAVALVVVAMYILQIAHLADARDLYHAELEVGSYQNMVQVLDYIYADAQGKPFGIMVYTAPVYDYNWEYLMGWYGQKRYGYTPARKKQELTYLVIEPDAEKPWRAKGWLETVIRVGVTKSTKEFKNGVVVEKRIFSPDQVSQ